ncbi:MAG: 50S ribosomal protein L5 [Parcubacteria group bacterium]|nr:50S ribosomal protein L5 [Parcubacteria group bacterium]
MTRLQEQFKSEVVPQLQKELEVGHVMAVPRVEKVVVNSGFGRLVAQNPQTKGRVVEQIEKLLTLITGQKPAPRKARQSISGFKVREGEVIGFQVTLRGKRMYDFLERLIRIALPRTRDFQGIPLSGIDQGGSLTVGVKEHIVFPETTGEETKQLFGFEISIVPSTRKRSQAIALYRALGIPLQRE